jgi:hypothetical protein
VVTLVMQGGSGNSQSTPPGGGAPAQQQALAWQRQLRALVDTETQDGQLGLARVEVPLPCPDASRLVPLVLAPAARNILCRWLPRSVELVLVQVGRLRLLGVPGEPTLDAAHELEVHAVATRVVGLTGGYVGYVEVPDRVRTGTGESRRQYFGPDLLTQLERGADVLTPAALRPGGSSSPPAAP